MTSQLVTLHTPGLKWWLDHLHEKFHPDVSVDLFIGALKRRTIQAPGTAARGTVQLFLRLIYAHPFSSIRGLVAHISSVGSDLSNARPLEFSVRNMARRVIGIIREEAENNEMGDLFLAALEAEDIPDVNFSSKVIGRPPPSTTHTSFASPSDSVTGVFEILSVASSSRESSAASSPPQTGAGELGSQFRTVERDIRPAVIQDIQELLDELDSCDHNISELATQVVHKNEVIMTYGLPPAVHKFLLRASQERDFTVVVVTGSANTRRQTNAALMNKSPSKKGEGDDEQDLASKKTLQDRGIPVIAISVNDTWNFMPKVTKVILAADYVFADGGLLATAGAKSVVVAAKNHYKTVCVIAGTHTFCPMASFDNEDLVEVGAPVSVDYSQGAFLEHACVSNPLTDFITPGSVDAFITNNGLIAPNGIHRAILDMYHIPKCDLF